MSTSKSFFGTLFDLSFDHFLTTKAIRLLYIINMVVAVIVIVGVFASGAAGKASILIAPIAGILYLLFSRIFLELTIVLFRIADHTRDVAGELKAAAVKNPEFT